VLTAGGDGNREAAMTARGLDARTLAVLGVAATPPPAPRPTVVPRLVVPDVDAAAGFYARALGATPLFGLRDRAGGFVYGEVALGDGVVVLKRADPARGLPSPHSLGGTAGSLMVYVADVDASFAVALAAGGVAHKAPTDMAWGDRYAELVDPFGHRWALATRRAAGERASAATTAFAPPGYRAVSLYLVAAEASALIDFYSSAFGAVVLERTLGADGSIEHAALQLGDSVVMVADEVAGGALASPAALGDTPIGAVLYTGDAGASFAAALAAGGAALGPVADRYSGDRAGEIEDPAGFRWQVATRVEQLAPAEIQRRMLAQP
jgi:PhnB protein